MDDLPHAVVSLARSGRRVFNLSMAEHPYGMFVENMRDGAATLSAQGVILYANRRLAELLSCDREAIVGSALAKFMADDAIGSEDLHRTGRPGITVEFDLIDAHGDPVQVLVGASPLELDGEHLTCLTFTDITARTAQDREIVRLVNTQAERMAELQDAQAALTRSATHDGLTGLPNRDLLLDRIEQALLYSQRSGRCSAVLFVDLDRFKHVNDTQGHAAGDLVLRKVAGQLVAGVRPMDTVARVGGDEFVILAPDVDSQAHAVDIGSRLRAALVGPCRQHVAASIGIAVSVAGQGTAESLLHEADTAMYQAKSMGGDRAVIFDTALGLQVQQRLIAQRMLQSALDDHRVIAYYQPVIDLSGGNIVGFEALARITERDGSIVPPVAFIPGAEENGLVVLLGAQVLEMACHEARLWRPTADATPRLTVAVNLSSRQFEPGNLATIVSETLERTGLDPACLHLELTETAIMDLRPDILQQLELITNLGVQVGLDDFGTGYASLTHLRRLPLSFVKIDQSFVLGLGRNQGDERIVAAVVDLAANLGMRSIAEGVETSDHLARLRELGCDQAQGYLFARPLSSDDVPAACDYAAW